MNPLRVFFYAWMFEGKHKRLSEDREVFSNSGRADFQGEKFTKKTTLLFLAGFQFQSHWQPDLVGPNTHKKGCSPWPNQS
jgi:hypothetical protein